LEHDGVASRAQAAGSISVLFGGQTVEYGKKMAQRTCAAPDPTGHAILHTLPMQFLRGIYSTVSAGDIGAFASGQFPIGFVASYKRGLSAGSSTDHAIAHPPRRAG
jgi:hypothetical protein